MTRDGCASVAPRINNKPSMTFSTPAQATPPPAPFSGRWIAHSSSVSTMPCSAMLCHAYALPCFATATRDGFLRILEVIRGRRLGSINAMHTRLRTWQPNCVLDGTFRRSVAGDMGLLGCRAGSFMRGRPASCERMQRDQTNNSLTSHFVSSATPH